ncbi:DNA-directed RNA polymerases II and V subunit 8A [Vitis vinifera]|uniref:DNA-directed RNA polymerases II and V subunit 8A n=1 Tax=Vitis vinifera TaxID=29760 RepID=A0A438DFW9_VITVI|nr:DNA-directed RNA polymerases II and V subunit 8A [Vitis vinifera]
MVLAPTLHLDGADVTDYFTQGERKSLATNLTMSCHEPCKYAGLYGLGSHFRVIYASFGGLLMILKGDPSNLNKLEVNKRLFLLMKKV